MSEEKPDWIRAGPRAYELMVMAYEEEGLPLPGEATVRERFNRLFDREVAWKRIRRHEPQILLYPRSFVEGAGLPEKDRDHQFNFLGLLYLPKVFPHRRWILDFARERFGEDSYFCITSLEGVEDYEVLGPFDRTLENAVSTNRRFVPKLTSKHERTHFDPEYFRIMSRSRFTLCPRGDEPWSMRFYEAIMCGSIPIVESADHIGRNRLEKAIGYRFYTLSDDFVFRPDWVEENYRRFIANQTLIERARTTRA